MACFTKIHQCNEANCKLEKIWNAKYVILTRQKSSQFRIYIYYMCAIKARNGSETHSPGVTGLHSRLRRSCNPGTQSRAFHCHFAHTHAFSLYYQCFRWAVNNIPFKNIKYMNIHDWFSAAMERKHRNKRVVLVENTKVYEVITWMSNYITQAIWGVITLSMP